MSQNSSLGVDIIFTLDVSKSMNVADFHDDNYYYTRLDLVKKSISDFVAKHPQDRFGLVIFAGEAVSSVPLTDDHDLFLTFLDGVDYKNLVKQGSDFLGAISQSSQRFTDEKRSKVDIFISDGGDSDDKVEYDEIKKIAKDNPGIHYFVAGVGTAEGGKIIDGQDVFGRYTYQTFHGEEVISKINIPNLKDIASALEAEFLQIKDISDLSRFNKQIDTFEKTLLQKGGNGELADFSRTLAFLSFLFFLSFLGFYFFNDRLGRKF